MLWQHAVLCNVMLRRVPCYGSAFCASLRDTHVSRNEFYVFAVVGVIIEYYYVKIASRTQIAKYLLEREMLPTQVVQK
jgi:20S proteasome alpha/beta subunit